MEIKEISRQEYDDFLQGVENYSFLQTSSMNEVLISNGRKTKLLGLLDGEEILAVGLAFYRNIYGGERMDLMVGASSTKPENEYLFYKYLKAYVKDSDVLKLVIKLDHDYKLYDINGNPISEGNEEFSEKMNEIGYESNDGSIPSYDGSPDWQYIKDLEEFKPDNYKDLMKSFNNNAKRQIKKAIELGIKVREISLDEMEEFKTLTLETAERQGFGDKSLGYYSTFYKEFGDNSEFLVSEIDLNGSIEKVNNIIEDLKKSPKKNKQKIESLKNDIDMLVDFKENSGKDKLMLANMIIIYQDNEAVYFLGGSLTDYQKLPGPFALQFEAMKRTMEKEIYKYNFFGIDGDFEGNDGVLRFKQNFNGYILRKAGAFIYYPNPVKYKSLDALKKIKNKVKG